MARIKSIDDDNEAFREENRRSREHLDALIVTAERALNQACMEALHLYSSGDTAILVFFVWCGAVRRWNGE
jgi:hypothetical protein